jgi:hypothetical protein
VLVISLAAVAFPIYVIRPFRYQGALEFRIALLVLRWAPWITVACALVALLLFIPIWRNAAGRRLAWLRRTALVLAALLVASCALAARLNIFEKMFHPISAVSFLPVSQAKVEPADMLMVVNIGGEVHGYPIREMAYHHLVNDVVGGTPVVATY